MVNEDEVGDSRVKRLRPRWIIVAIVVVAAVGAVAADVGVMKIGNSDSSGSADAEVVTRQLLTNELTRVGYLDAEISDVQCAGVSDRENEYTCVVTALFYGSPKTTTGILRCKGTKPANTCSWRGAELRSS